MDNLPIPASDKIKIKFSMQQKWNIPLPFILFSILSHTNTNTKTHIKHIWYPLRCVGVNTRCARNVCVVCIYHISSSFIIIWILQSICSFVHFAYILYITINHRPINKSIIISFKSLHPKIQFNDLHTNGAQNHSIIHTSIPLNHMSFTFSNIHTFKNTFHNHTYIFGIDIGIGIQQNLCDLCFPITSCHMKRSLATFMSSSWSFVITIISYQLTNSSNFTYPILSYEKNPKWDIRK